jgi:hypothetical protein
VATVLAVSDEVVPGLLNGQPHHPDLITACGDLPFDYLEELTTILGAPLVYVPGNHDPDLKIPPPPQASDFVAPFFSRKQLGPQWCTNVDGRVVRVAGLLVAGLGGSRRYRPGPNQYTETQMRRRAWLLAFKSIPRGAVSLLITHAAPRGLGDEEDPAHAGFSAFHDLVRRTHPKVLVHGHVHPFGRDRSDASIGETTVVNAVGHRVIEVSA